MDKRTSAASTFDVFIGYFCNVAFRPPEGVRLGRNDNNNNIPNRINAYINRASARKTAKPKKQHPTRAGTVRSRYVCFLCVCVSSCLARRTDIIDIHTSVRIKRENGRSSSAWTSERRFPGRPVVDVIETNYNIIIRTCARLYIHIYNIRAEPE